MRHDTPALETDKYYHVFNHALSNENLFKNDENYRFI